MKRFLSIAILAAIAVVPITASSTVRSVTFWNNTSRCAFITLYDNDGSGWKIDGTPNIVVSERSRHQFAQNTRHVRMRAEITHSANCQSAVDREVTSLEFESKSTYAIDPTATLMGSTGTGFSIEWSHR